MKNIFVVALDAFNHRLLRTIRGAEAIRFHNVLDYERLVSAGTYDMPALMAEAEATLMEFPGGVDGLIAYWDFPSTTMAPLLRDRVGLPGTSFESVLRCEHKYWSRLVQREVVPEMVPDFRLVDPFAEDAAAIDLDFPFWLKPIQAHSSFLGFRIESRDDLEQALNRIRRRIHRFGEPFNHLLKFADLPGTVAGAGGMHCIAEEIISAENQCTLEGYVLEGRTHVYGVVDSLRADGGSSFTRYQYPSKLPRQVQEEMIDIAGRVMTRIGLEREAFNMEFFHDPDSGRLALLEINPRISKSHCPLFFHVDGVSHQQVQVALALGRKPEMPRRRGRFPLAAKFMLRRFEDARVVSVPDEEEIRKVCEAIPGTMIRMEVAEGVRLGDLENQDSYSYEYGVVFVGGEDEAELEEKYEEVMERLPVEFVPVAEDGS